MRQASDVRSELLTARIAGAARTCDACAIWRAATCRSHSAPRRLSSSSVRVAKLGLGIVDEQHRFGVFDRAKLKALGPKANVLMMTATPIPRSLAMSLFANLDVSVLDELPPGRTPIATEIFPEDRLDEVDAIVADEIARGHRAYYVLPLIDNDDDDEDGGSENGECDGGADEKGRAARRRHRHPARADEGGIDKDRVMREFRDGIIKVLIATTVVEVGYRRAGGDGDCDYRGGEIRPRAVASAARPGRAWSGGLAMLPGDVARGRRGGAGADCKS